MRTEPDVDKIFVLIKAKNQEAAVDRMKTEVAFFNDLFFFFFFLWCSKQDLLSFCVDHRFRAISVLEEKTWGVLSRFHANQTGSCYWEYV